MSTPADIAAAMAACGLSAEQVAAVLSKLQVRSAGAERQARYRARKGSQTVTCDVTCDVTKASPNVTEVTPSRVGAPAGVQFTQNLEVKKERKSAGNVTRDDAFGRFWQVWPHKVGKPAAESAFARHFLEIDAILEGLQRYIRDKPPDRPWLNPSTFLNQRRWEDAPATVSPVYRGPPGSKPYTLQDSLDSQARRDRIAQDRLKYA